MGLHSPPVPCKLCLTTGFAFLGHFSHSEASEGMIFLLQLPGSNQFLEANSISNSSLHTHSVIKKYSGYLNFKRFIAVRDRLLLILLEASPPGRHLPHHF